MPLAAWQTENGDLRIHGTTPERPIVRSLLTQDRRADTGRDRGRVIVGRSAFVGRARPSVSMRKVVCRCAQCSEREARAAAQLLALGRVQQVFSESGLLACGSLRRLIDDGRRAAIGLQAARYSYYQVSAIGGNFKS